MEIYLRFNTFILTYEGNYHRSERRIVLLSDDSKLATERYSLTLCTTISKDVITQDVLLFFQSYSLLQQSFNLRTVVFTESPAVFSLKKKYNLTVIPSVKLNAYHKPVFSSIMQYAEQTWNTQYYGYVNGDILLSPMLFDVLLTLKSNEYFTPLQRPYMLAGRVSEVQTYSLDMGSIARYSESFEALYRKGKRRNSFSADYFIYSGKLMSHPGMMYEDVVLGRYYIDNWVMGMVLLHDGILIDSTEASSE